MKERMVKLISTVDETVVVNYPQYNVYRKWTRRGQPITLPYSVVEQLNWEQGFNNMLRDGTLYIEDMKTKIDLGLEEEGTKEPTNIVILTEKQMERLLTKAPIDIFEEVVNSLNKTQAKNLAYYAINNKLIDYTKDKILEKITNVNIGKTIENLSEPVQA